jgi:hypothetical protein
MAPSVPAADTGGVTTTRTLGFLLWPLGTLAAVAVMVMFLRWAYSPGHSLVQRRPQPGAPDEYGMLTTVASPATFIEGEKLRLMLADSGIRATLAPTTAGPRLMVFPQDASIARALLENPRPA